MKHKLVIYPFILEFNIFCRTSVSNSSFSHIIIRKPFSEMYSLFGSLGVKFFPSPLVEIDKPTWSLFVQVVWNKSRMIPSSVETWLNIRSFSPLFPIFSEVTHAAALRVCKRHFSSRCRSPVVLMFSFHILCVLIRSCQVQYCPFM